MTRAFLFIDSRAKSQAVLPLSLSRAFNTAECLGSLLRVKMQKAKIKLIGRDKEKLDDICSQIIDIAKKADVDVSGIIRIPTKKLKLTTLKSPDGEGSSTWEHWEMRIHKRLVMIAADEKALRRVMRIQIPKDVHVEIRL